MKSLAISQVHFLLYCRKRMLKFFFFNYLDASLTIPLQKRFDKKVVTSFLQNLRCFKITIYVGKMRGTKPSAHFKAYSISSYFKTWYYFPPFIAITAPVSSVLKLTLMRIGYSPVGKLRPDVDFIAKEIFWDCSIRKWDERNQAICSFYSLWNHLLFLKLYSTLYCPSYILRFKLTLMSRWLFPHEELTSWRRFC